MTSSKTSTPKALLVVALQDLHDGERAWITRFDGIGHHIEDERFAARMAAYRNACAEHAERLKNAADDLDADVAGAENIWLNAILDDARRDTEMIAPGRLLDIALIGAVRKGLQAKRVSYETAIALARSLDLAAAGDLVASRDEKAAADKDLSGLLEEIATAPGA